MKRRRASTMPSDDATPASAEPTVDNRWPRSLYGTGTEPDPRFTFANERTFLAWIRTALALLAAAIAVEAFGEDLEEFRIVVAAALAILGMTISGSAYTRWMAAERAMRNREALPSLRLGLTLAVGVTLVGGLAAAAALWP